MYACAWKGTAKREREICKKERDIFVNKQFWSFYSEGKCKDKNILSAEIFFKMPC